MNSNGGKFRATLSSFRSLIFVFGKDERGNFRTQLSTDEGETWHDLDTLLRGGDAPITPTFGMSAAEFHEVMRKAGGSAWQDSLEDFSVEFDPIHYAPPPLPPPYHILPDSERSYVVIATSTDGRRARGTFDPATDSVNWEEIDRAIPPADSDYYWRVNGGEPHSIATPDEPSPLPDGGKEYVREMPTVAEIPAIYPEDFAPVEDTIPNVPDDLASIAENEIPIIHNSAFRHEYQWAKGWSIDDVSVRELDLTEQYDMTDEQTAKAIIAVKARQRSVERLLHIEDELRADYADWSSIEVSDDGRYTLGQESELTELADWIMELASRIAYHRTRIEGLLALANTRRDLILKPKA